MKKIIKRIFKKLGYNISRTSKTNLNQTIDTPVVLRNSMLKAIEWLKESHFDVRTVLDVGASDGRWSKDCIRYYPDSNYVLFEPQSCHFNMLDALEREMKGKLSVVRKAAGQNSGKTYFDITDPFGGSLSDFHKENTIEVSQISIDDCIIELGFQGPFLMKLDTHGFEIPILEGAATTLRDCNVLIIEAYNYNIESGSILFWQLCEFLYKKGFRPVDMVDIMYRKYDDSLWQMDIVFIKTSWQGFDYKSYK